MSNTTPVLMSRENPDGWKLEDLLEQVYKELESKNKYLANQLEIEQETQSSHVKVEVLTKAIDGNELTLARLSNALESQRWVVNQFNKLGQDKGPSEPRI